MKKKLIITTLLIGTFALGTLFGGCDGNNTTAKADTENTDNVLSFEYIGCQYVGKNMFCEYRDTKTGVHYITTDHGGITARYDPNSSRSNNVYAD